MSHIYESFDNALSVRIPYEHRLVIIHLISMLPSILMLALMAFVVMFPVAGFAKPDDACKDLKGQARAQCVRTSSSSNASSSSTSSHIPEKGAKPDTTCKDHHKEWHKKMNAEHKTWHKDHKKDSEKAKTHKDWHKNKNQEHKDWHKAMKAGQCPPPTSSSSSSSSSPSSTSSSSSSSSSEESSASSSSSSSAESSSAPF